MNTVKRRYHAPSLSNGPSLVVFGTATVDRDGRTNGLNQNHLIERQSSALTLVLHTDEYLTSQACNVCGGQLSPVTTNNQQDIFVLKPCTSSCMFWDLDAFAASYKLWAARSMVEVWARPALPRTTSSR
ncbi:hypothetical protein DM01DRAFT_1340419 [Hesseltinella vesiculosa]|uniref:Uncharacterized protein n=1 Tax=Hesseltinella vesiculosa TaxID=101127 RepID=A0A1X2G477_9FUNG|nr:hypothetical protein DM01DRAFT_1340419 [Hesseltinella vesiculosa]